MTERIRIGATNSLPARVFLDPLGTRTPRYTVSLGEPDEIASGLASGEFDVALVPAVEYYRAGAEGYRIVPDASISTRGEAGSMRLYARVDLADVKRLGLDPMGPGESLLARVLLAERFGARPKCARLNASGPAAGRTAAAGRAKLDAFVVAGDAALGALARAGAWCAHDLDALWWERAHLPFVHAVWLARPGVGLTGVDKDVLLAKRGAAERLASLARREAAEIGLEPAELASRLTRAFVYDLSRTELGGMQTFYRYAVRDGLAPDGRELEFYR